MFTYFDFVKPLWDHCTYTSNAILAFGDLSATDIQPRTGTFSWPASQGKLSLDVCHSVILTEGSGYKTVCFEVLFAVRSPWDKSSLVYVHIICIHTCTLFVERVPIIGNVLSRD